MLSYCIDVWNSVCSMWKPILSVAYHVRLVVMPPKARVETLPSSLRLNGQPQRSSWASSFGAFFDEVLDDVLVAQEVRTFHGVVAVHLDRVVFSRDGGGAALGRDGVTPHRIDLRHQCDTGGRIGFDGGDGRTQAGPPATDDHDVMANHVDHGISLGFRALARLGWAQRM